MNDLRPPTRPGASGPPVDAGHRPDPEIADDLDALRSVTSRNQPDLETVVRAARSRTDRETTEGFTMLIRMLKRRPALAAALTVFVIGLGLSVVPISYQRTVGYDVVLTLDGATMAADRVSDVARGLESVLGADGVDVASQMDDGHLTYRLSASAPGDVRRTALAFARSLEDLGYGASVDTTPRTETISTSVAAYAYDRVIRISTDGKSAAQLENEIRQQLAAAGITANVSVTEGDGHREVRIGTDQKTVGGGAGGPDFPELVLTRDGKPLTGGNAVRVTKTKDASGAIEMVVSMEVNGRTVEARIPNAGTMSDAAIEAEIRSQLLAAGFDADVTVQGNDIRIKKR